MRAEIVQAAQVALEVLGVPARWYDTTGTLVGQVTVLPLRDDRTLERLGLSADAVYARSLMAFLVRRADVQSDWLIGGARVQLWPDSPHMIDVMLSRHPNVPVWEPADADGVFVRVHGYRSL